MTTRTQLVVSLLFASALAAAASRAQESSQFFDAAMVIASQTQRIDDVVDLDGDGDLDLIGWWWADSDQDAVRVRSWFNDGAGRFLNGYSFIVNLPGPYQLSGQPLQVSRSSGVADFDGDGLNDYVFSLGAELFFLKGAGAGNPTLTTSFSFASAGFLGLSTDVALGDYDGDGDLDVAWCGRDLRFFLNQGGVSFVAGSTFSLGTTGPIGRLIALDADGDGIDDLLHDRNGVLTRYQVAGGAVQSSTAFVHGLATTLLPTRGDVDGDGDDDVVVFSESTYRVLRNGGGGAFVVEAPQVGGPAEHLADVDGDGDLDGVCCSSGTGYPSPILNTAPSVFRISLNDGTGVFAPAFEIEGLGADALAGAHDVDGDGDADLVAGRVVYHAAGPLAAAPQVEVGVLPRRSQIHDLHRDGDPDVVTSFSSVFVNDGAGGFSQVDPGVAAPPGTYFTSSPWSGDFDGDGFVDVLARHIDPAVTFSAYRGMHLLRGDGGGGFTDAGLAGGTAQLFVFGGPLSGGGSVDSDVADLDGDGDLDLISTGTSSSRQWLNDGTGFFTYGPGFAGEVARHADLDGDGHLDVILLNGNVQYGLGGGAFAAPVSLGSFCTGGDVADLDGDGDLDLVAFVPGPVSGTCSVRVYTNEGARSFSSGPDLSAVPGQAVRFAQVLDANGDGLLDIVAGYSTSGAFAAYSEAAVCIRKTDLSGYEAPVFLVMRGTAVLDVDGDGDRDLVGGRIYRNRTWEEPAAGVRQQYGVGTPGSGGLVPTYGASGPFRGGSTATVHVTGLVGGALVFAVIGDQRVDQIDSPLPGFNTYTNSLAYVAVLAGGTPGVPGVGEVHVPYFIPPVLGGSTFYHQAFAYDPGTSAQYSGTNGLALTYR